MKRRNIKKCFTNISKESFAAIQDFSEITKKFLTNKGYINSGDIMLTKGRNIITDEEESVKVFNNYYVNIVERSCDRKPIHMVHDNRIGNITLAIELITK